MSFTSKLCIAVLVAGAGCADSGDFTDEERAELQTFVLDDSTPIPPSPSNKYADNPKAAALGHQFFFDKRMIPATAAGNCRTCHDLTLGGADTKSRTPTTVFGTLTLGRNTPTIFNTAFLTGMNHWGGNFTAPWSVTSDFGTSALEQAHFIYSDPDYRAKYEELFGPMPDFDDLTRFPPVGNYRSPVFAMMTPEDQKALGRFTTNYGKALEAYERKLLDKNSAFDLYMNGDEKALSAPAIRGAKLFIGKAGCNECHNGPTFSDMRFHNLGVPQGNLARDFGHIAAGAFQATFPYNANSEFSDDREMGIALAANVQPIATADLPFVCGGSDPMPGCGAFKTARLRSIALTAPYMHTGGFKDLWDVVEFYNQGGGSPGDGFVGRRDAAMAPLHLSDDEIADLVAFLSSLTGAPIPDEWAKCPPSVPTASCTGP
jgi:cytochrome c peroxidase